MPEEGNILFRHRNASFMEYSDGNEKVPLSHHFQFLVHHAIETKDRISTIFNFASRTIIGCTYLSEITAYFYLLEIEKQSDAFLCGARVS